ncbi:branched-chain amino acid aminotransferase [Lentisphaerota bacterium ZTH]|nr:branched-chain amino acid aminotransferase [Lentisphaerota bacterium]WET05870.1 branched-chain amino acid aminotransferase [Lentisphaerota bacterium ZTH]
MNIDWENLGFEYSPTKSNIRFSYHNGEWSEGKLVNSSNITLSIASNCLHYGQAAFEGLKAFACKDGKVRIFRPEENARRLNDTADYLLMPKFPEDKFVEAVKTVVKDNIDYVPPYGTGGALYIRPVLIGTTSQIGISAAEDYELIILVCPVGPYYKGGIKPVNAMILDDFDRAAPGGTGHVKVAGNYAASLYPTRLARQEGCHVTLFMDAKTHEFIDEFGSSNFVAVTAEGSYVTPKSRSVLPSITNKSLMVLAEDLGLKVERRPIHRSELEEFAEVGAVGTAVVITPVGKIVHKDKVLEYGDTIGPVLKRLYDEMTGIQYGEIPDRHHWMLEV